MTTTKNRHPAKGASSKVHAETAAHEISEHPRPANRPHSAGESTGRKPPGRARAGSQKQRTTPLVLQTLEENRDIYKDLPPKRRAPMRRAMQQIADLLIQSTYQQAAGEAATFEQRAQTAVDTLRVIALGDSRQVQSVIEALEPMTPEDPGAVDLEEAEARGRLRLQALYRKIVTDSYSVADLRSEWGITRQRLAQLRQEDRLFAISVPFHRGMLYPRWQFGVDQRPKPIMPNLIEKAKSVGLDAIGFHQLMTNPASGADTSPVQMLDCGQEELVLGIILASGS